METEETLPFPPPLARQTSRERAVLMTKRSNTPSLEQLTEARLAELRNEHFLWETPAPRSDRQSRWRRRPRETSVSNGRS